MQVNRDRFVWLGLGILQHDLAIPADGANDLSDPIWLKICNSPFAVLECQCRRTQVPCFRAARSEHCWP